MTLHQIDRADEWAKRALTVWCLLLCLAVVSAAKAEPLEINSVQRRLQVERPQEDRVGALRFRGALELSSPDPRFGGLSGLLISPDGRRLVAITDQGNWVTARLSYDEAGNLTDLSDAEIAPLLGTDGQPLSSKRMQDAESLARLPDGAILVAFEHRHRIWRYPPIDDGEALVPKPLPLPPGRAQLHPNSGFEALALLDNGDLLVIAQDPAAHGDFPAYLLRDQRWHRLDYRRHGLFRPTGAARLPDGDLLVLERLATFVGGISVRLLRLPAAEIKPGALLEGRELALLRPPLTIDNMEGVAARRAPQGETLIYLISDDNFHLLQRSLLMMFELVE